MRGAERVCVREAHLSSPLGLIGCGVASSNDREEEDPPSVHGLRACPLVMLYPQRTSLLTKRLAG